jgi:hypothetical protein
MSFFVTLLSFMRWVSGGVLFGSDFLIGAATFTGGSSFVISGTGSVQEYRTETLRKKQ